MNINDQEKTISNQKPTYSILGCGWLGYPLAKYFLEKGCIVKGSTRSEEKIAVFKKDGIIPYQINIEDAKVNVSNFFDCDVLLIMITSKSFEAYQALVNVIASSTIKKVIFISSTSVYPRGNKTYTEDDATNGNLLTKVEQLFRDRLSFKTTIIRFAGLYADKRHPGNWFANRKIPQPNGFVNMIHRDDCIQIINQLIEKDIFGETFNACTDHHPTRKEYYQAARKSLQKPAPEFEKPEELRYKIISPSKLIKKLDYTFLYPDVTVFE